MQILPSHSAADHLQHVPAGSTKAPAALTDPQPAKAAGQSELREVFDDFVGQTFFQQLLGAMRKTVDKPAYFHGGRAEEVFQGQLDQVLSEKMTTATADKLTGPMFDLFQLGRQ